MINPTFKLTGEEAKGLLFGLLEVSKEQFRENPDWPSFRELVRQGRIRYRESDPEEHWKSARELYDELEQFGVAYGDCEELATTAAAEDQVRYGIASLPFAYNPRKGLFHVVTAVPASEASRYGALQGWPGARMAPDHPGYVLQDISAAAGMGREHVEQFGSHRRKGMDEYGGLEERLKRRALRKQRRQNKDGIFKSLAEGLGLPSTKDFAKQVGEGVREALGEQVPWSGKAVGEQLVEAVAPGAIPMDSPLQAAASAQVDPLASTQDSLAQMDEYDLEGLSDPGLSPDWDEDDLVFESFGRLMECFEDADEEYGGRLDRIKRRTERKKARRELLRQKRLLRGERKEMRKARKADDEDDDNGNGEDDESVADFFGRRPSRHMSGSKRLSRRPSRHMSSKRGFGRMPSRQMGGRPIHRFTSSSRTRDQMSRSYGRMPSRHMSGPRRPMWHVPDFDSVTTYGDLRIDADDFETPGVTQSILRRELFGAQPRLASVEAELAKLISSGVDTEAKRSRFSMLMELREQLMQGSDTASPFIMTYYGAIADGIREATRGDTEQALVHLDRAGRTLEQWAREGYAAPLGFFEAATDRIGRLEGAIMTGDRTSIREAASALHRYTRKSLGELAELYSEEEYGGLNLKKIAGDLGRMLGPKRRAKKRARQLGRAVGPKRRMSNLRRRIAKLTKMGKHDKADALRDKLRRLEREA